MKENQKIYLYNKTYIKGKLLNNYEFIRLTTSISSVAFKQKLKYKVKESDHNWGKTLTKNHKISSLKYNLII